MIQQPSLHLCLVITLLHSLSDLKVSAAERIFAAASDTAMPGEHVNLTGVGLDAPVTTGMFPRKYYASNSTGSGIELIDATNQYWGSFARLHVPAGLQAGRIVIALHEKEMVNGELRDVLKTSIAINQAQPQWVWPPRVRSGWGAGQSIRIFGKGLVLENWSDGNPDATYLTPAAKLVGPHDPVTGPEAITHEQDIILSSTQDGTYSLAGTVAANLSLGNYSVKVRNDSSDANAWSMLANCLQCEAQTAFNKDGVVRYTLSPSPTGTDDFIKIQTALTAAATTNAAGHSTPGGEVRLTPGTYYLSQTATVAKNVKLIGWENLSPPNSTGAANLGTYDFLSDTVTNSGTRRSVVIRAHPAAVTAKLPELIYVEGDNAVLSRLNVIHTQYGSFVPAESPASAPTTYPIKDGQSAVRVSGKNVQLNHVRMVLKEGRTAAQDTTWAMRPALLLTGSGVVNDNPARYLTANFCEFYSHCGGVGVGHYLQAGHDITIGVKPEQAADGVALLSCKFYGTYQGSSAGLAYLGQESAHANGVNLNNGRNILIEDCLFKSLSRNNASTTVSDTGVVTWPERLLLRSVLGYNTRLKNVYIAGNTSDQVGWTDTAMMQAKTKFGFQPSVAGAKPTQTAGGNPATSAEVTDGLRNASEQYLFHFRHPHAGIFEVASSSTSSTVVRVDNIPQNPYQTNHFWRAYDNTKSRAWVSNATGASGHPVVKLTGGLPEDWVLFICKGRGAGQYREIIDGVHNGTTLQPATRVTYTVKTPWAVAPDGTSRVVLMAAYRNIILYGNTIDQDSRGDTARHHSIFSLVENIERGCKVQGVGFWFNAFNNVVSHNRFRNLTGGVFFNACYRNPTGWNLVTDNDFDNIYAGFSGDTMFANPHGLQLSGARCYEDNFRLTLWTLATGSSNAATYPWPNTSHQSVFTIANTLRNSGYTAGAAPSRQPLAVNTMGWKLPGPFTRPPSDPQSGMMLSLVENNLFNIGGSTQAENYMDWDSVSTPFGYFFENDSPSGSPLQSVDTSPLE